MRDRVNGKAEGKMNGNKIVVDVTHSLDRSMYNLPLTLRTSVPSSWKNVTIKQGDNIQKVAVKNGKILYNLTPNAGEAVIEKM